MKRFVKVKSDLITYKEWYLVVTPEEDDTYSEADIKAFRAKMSLRLVPKHDRSSELSGWTKLKLHLSQGTDLLNHKKRAQEYGETILVRPIGSYMPLRGNTIIEEVYALDFPLENEEAKICICENDEHPETFWVHYLNKRFKGQPVKVINFFSQRSEDQLKKDLADLDLITFSTTFTNLGWVEKLKRNMRADTPILGFSHDRDAWEDAKSILATPNLEIVDQNKEKDIWRL